MFARLLRRHQLARASGRDQVHVAVCGWQGHRGPERPDAAADGRTCGPAAVRRPWCLRDHDPVRPRIAAIRSSADGTGNTQTSFRGCHRKEDVARYQAMMTAQRNIESTLVRDTPRRLGAEGLHWTAAERCSPVDRRLASQHRRAPECGDCAGYHFRCIGGHRLAQVHVLVRAYQEEPAALPRATALA